MKTEFIYLGLILFGAVLFSFLLITFIVVYRKKKAQRRIEKIEMGFREGLTGNARIVAAERAEIQWNKKIELYKVVLEVSPANLQSTFSTSVVWEIEPQATHLLKVGELIPIRVDSTDTRRVFPDLAGFRYSYQYQYALLGIEDKFQPEQIIATQNLAPTAPKPKTIYRKRSEISLFGMPLWEVAFNLKHHKYAPRAEARAVIAIGDSATGLIAIGSIARGFIAVGGLSFGLISVGGLSFGIFSFGLVAIGLVALGTIGGGLLAIGGVSAGFVSAGLLPFGQYIFGKDFQSPITAQLFQGFKSLIGLNYNLFDFVVIASIIGFATLMLLLFGQVILNKMLPATSNSLESPRRSARKV